MVLLCVPLLTFITSIWQDPYTPPQQSQSRYIYAVLAYLTTIPGIFAFTLNLYAFLFERQSIWTMSLVMQVLPIIAMVIILIMIKKMCLLSTSLFSENCRDSLFSFCCHWHYVVCLPPTHLHHHLRTFSVYRHWFYWNVIVD